MGFEAHRHARGIGADDAAAEDHHARGRNTGDAAEQLPSPAGVHLETGGAGLDRHAAGDFAHRREQRQAAARIGDGLVGDADDARVEQRLGLRRIGREMEIGEERLAGLEQLDFLRLRLLHLHDHVGFGEHRGSVGKNARAGARVDRVGKIDGVRGVGFDEDGVTVRGEFAHGRGRHADAVFVVLDLLGNADLHGVA